MDTNHHLARGRFSDFDQLAGAIAAWDLDWRQLDPGRLEAEFVQLGHGTALLGRFFFSRRFFQSGGTPPGIRTFGVLDEGTHPITACGRTMGDQTILAFPSDYEATSEPGFRAHSISFSEEALVAAASELGAEDVLERVLGSGGPMPCEEKSLRILRGRLDQLHSELDASPSAARAIAFRREIEIELPMLLVRTLTSSEPSGWGAGRLPGNRDRIALRARTFIEEQANDPPTIDAVSRYAGVSRRTLEYAFREHLGVTPKRYLQAVRLQNVRRDLQQADSGARVADVANHWGFWHMGQFAADYRRWFGELPSETLSQSLGS